MNKWLKTLAGIVSRKGAKAASQESQRFADELEEVKAARDAVERVVRTQAFQLVRMKGELLLLRPLAKPFPVVEGDEADWKVAHQEAWLQFLKKTAAGETLLAKVNFQEQAMNRSAVLRTAGAENNTGFARGWHACSQYFFKALPISADVRPQQDDDTYSGDGAARLRERLAP